MVDLGNRLFRLRPGELGLVLVLGFVLLSNSLARQVSGIVAVSGFLSEGGVNQILIVMLVDYCLVLVTAGLQTLIVDKFDRVSLMNAMTFGFALVFTLLRLMFTFHIPHWLNYSILYIVAEQQLITFPLVFWVLANDVFDMAQTKRLFPLIASWGFIGKILGTGVAALSPDLFSRLGILPEEVLTLNVLIYLLAYLLMFIGLRKVKVRQSVQQHETVRETLNEGWSFVREIASFRYLVLAIVALAVCDTIIEFRFFVVTDAIFPGAADYQRFYSLYRLCAVLAGFLMQTFLTSRLINKINLKNNFLIFPIVILTSGLGMIALPGIMTAVGAMFMVKLTRETVDESGRKSFQALVPEERRGRVSTFMDSYLPAVGTIIGCLAAGAIVLIGLKLQTQSYFYVYLAVVMVGGLVALWAILKMRTVYDSSMFNWRLKRRQRGGSVLDKLEF